jgi:hypothetical protein
LARQVYQKPQEIEIRDVERELNSERLTELNVIGVNQYEIRGPLFACPVRTAGQTEAVLVTWLKNWPAKARELGAEKARQYFRSSCGQIVRLANILANDIDYSGSPRAAEFLNALYGNLDGIDAGRVWEPEDLRDPSFRQNLMNVLMQSLLNEVCGFHCVRVWETTRGRKDPVLSAGDEFGFECIDSLSSEKGTYPGLSPRAAYADLFTSENDIYCRYTLARFEHDPLARWQHPAMFGNTEDGNAKRLHKDLGGPWIVAPIVRPKVNGKHQLLGFISADSHTRNSGTPTAELERDPRVTNLQCRFMDLIAELSRHLLAQDIKVQVAPPAVGR